MFVEAVRAVVSPVTLRTSKKRLKLIRRSQDRTHSSESRKEDKSKKCKVM